MCTHTELSHLWRLRHDDFSGFDQSQVLQCCHIAQLCHFFTGADRCWHSCWTVNNKHHMISLSVSDVSYRCVLTTGIRSWWVCLQLCSPVDASNLLLSELSRWDSWIEARPISWSLLVESLCQTSTTRGTLQHTRTHFKHITSHYRNKRQHCDWMFTETKIMLTDSPTAPPAGQKS